MKKILVTRRLLRSCEDKAETNFKAILNSNTANIDSKLIIGPGGWYIAYYMGFSRVCFIVLCSPYCISGVLY